MLLLEAEVGSVAACAGPGLTGLGGATGKVAGAVVEARARGCLACLGAARACPAGGSVARWEHAAGHA